MSPFVAPQGAPLPSVIDEVPAGLLDVDRCSTAEPIELSAFQFDPIPDFENERAGCYAEHTTNDGETWQRSRELYTNADGEITYVWNQALSPRMTEIGPTFTGYSRYTDGTAEFRAARNINIQQLELDESISVDVYQSGTHTENRAFGADPVDTIGSVLTFYESGENWTYEELYFRDATCERMRWTFTEFDDVGRRIERYGVDFGVEFHTSYNWAGNNEYAGVREGHWGREETTWDFESSPPRVSHQRHWLDSERRGVEIIETEYIYDEQGRPLLVSAGNHWGWYAPVRWNWDCLEGVDPLPENDASLHGAFRHK